jgi:class 3 adenylate cyclase
MATLPAGTVTFVFTDIEGSTRLLQQLGDRYADVAREHRRLLRDELGAAGGHEIDTQGDAFFFSFPRARDAVAGAVASQRALAAHEWPHEAEVRVRMGLHTGEPAVEGEGYLGLDVVRAARICAAGHGGQILLSETTRALLGNELPEGVTVHDLGEAHLKDVQHERIYQLTLDGQPGAFPPLKTHGETAVDVEQRAESLARRAEASVEQYVLGEIERAFAQGSRPAPGAFKLTATGLAILLLTVATFVAIALLVKVAFF